MLNLLSRKISKYLKKVDLLEYKRSNIESISQYKKDDQ